MTTAAENRAWLMAKLEERGLLDELRPIARQIFEDYLRDSHDAA